MEWLSGLTYLTQGSDQHDAGNERYHRCKDRKEREDHENISNVHVSNVDKLVADDVVTVMSWSRRCHRVTVEIKDSSDDCEERDKLR